MATIKLWPQLLTFLNIPHEDLLSCKFEFGDKNFSFPTLICLILAENCSKVNMTSSSISFISAAMLGYYSPWPQQFVANPTWHLISTTWSGMNGVVSVFVDGQWARAWEYLGTQKSFTGGGRFGLNVPEGQAFPISLTSINMWNHVLSTDVIAAQRVVRCLAVFWRTQRFNHKTSNMFGPHSESKSFRRRGDWRRLTSVLRKVALHQ